MGEEEWKNAVTSFGSRQYLLEQIAQLRATNARLAAALEEIADRMPGCPCMDSPNLAKQALTPDALDDLRVIREAMDAIDCGCTDDNCWRREAYAALKERFGDNK